MFAANGGAVEDTSKTYIEDVFSTYLYTGNGSTQTINNGIDLAGKGGMVWVKNRSDSSPYSLSNNLADTARGANLLFSNSTGAQSSWPTAITSFNSSGFSIGDALRVNMSNVTFTSWTFRKAPKFFDVVTYTGNGVAGRAISHSLGQAPGMIIIKATNQAYDWGVHHASLGFTKIIYLSATNASATNPYFVSASSSSSFTVGSGGLTSTYSNENGTTYVAYLFAHDTTADGLIKCGSYVANALDPVTVDLGWEPQYVMIKSAKQAASTYTGWAVFDNMRGIATGGKDPILYANTSWPEDLNATGANISTNYLDVTSTGFTVNPGPDATATGSETYIYMAIRRGPMRTPTDGTKVFKSLTRNGTNTTTAVTGIGFAPDAVITRSRSSTDLNFGVVDKLRGPNIVLATNRTDSDFNTSSAGYETITAFGSDGVTYGPDGYTYSFNKYTGQNYINWMFKRAPGFFDVVCYTGDGVDGRAVPHNLGVKPEFVIVKCRSNANYWAVRFLDPEFFVFSMNTNTAESGVGVAGVSDAGFIGNLNTLATATTFPVRDSGGSTGLDAVNASGKTYVAYLFASCPGVSKVGSYTGDSTSGRVIDCGFTNGARFVMIKATNTTSDWYVWDTARGIVVGNEPYLTLNTTNAESSADIINPASSGFSLNAFNSSGFNYIYLAIA